jgi:hypothetical protein
MTGYALGVRGLGQADLMCSDGLPADLENLPGGGVAYTCPEDVRIPGGPGVMSWLSRNQMAVLVGAAAVAALAIFRRRR